VLSCWSMSIPSSSNAPASTGPADNLAPDSKFTDGKVEAADSCPPAETDATLPIEDLADNSEIPPIREAAMADTSLLAEDSTEPRTASSVGGAKTGEKTNGPTCQCTTKGRNLIICIDGTANQFGMKVSNAVIVLPLPVQPLSTRIQMLSNFTAAL
jgi:hypothetical protein